MRKELKISQYSSLSRDGDFLYWLEKNHPDIIVIICNESGYYENGVMLENVLFEMYCRGEE
jgi:hypothetical protein